MLLVEAIIGKVGDMVQVDGMIAWRAYGLLFLRPPGERNHIMSSGLAGRVSVDICRCHPRDLAGYNKRQAGWWAAAGRAAA
jgi:hypothetical protein